MLTVVIYSLSEIFRAAAEAGPKDILKLYSAEGHLLSISPKLPENTPHTKYTLETVAFDIKGRPKYFYGHYSCGETWSILLSTSLEFLNNILTSVCHGVVDI